ncbi:MAG: Stk1 family PASTA domain-containing Ser/Thr kinase [Eubacteriales bacterium]|nr:Stk1 family PASTA domain-containing Ser/Thr kinase [Eubacteriales bacterium]
MLLNIGDKLADRYIIEEKIGQGGMSYVYKASDTKLGRVVAVKVLKSEFSADEEFIKKFKNEAKSAAKLSHPNIVTAYDTADEGNLHYIIMELVEGITLKNYIARKGKLSNKETLGIAIQAAEGIEEAHKKGIIHRDIKPQNIIISRDGKVKVADFGIAKAVSGETVNPAVIGSVHYISPEQAKTGIADMRSDLYSLGITMYEMITGKVPFSGDNTVNVVMAHIQEAIVPPKVYSKDIYPALNDIILKATKKNPDERYQTAGDLILDLKRCGREPDGHFVRMYASVDSKKTTKEDNTEEKAFEHLKSTDVKSDTESSYQAFNTDNEADKDIERDFVSNHINRNNLKQKKADTEQDQIKKLIRSGLILAVAVLLLVFVFSIINISGLFRSFSNDETAKSTLAEETSTTEETEESNYNITIYAEDIMPNLIGLTVDAAKEKTADLDIIINDKLTDYSDVYYEGLIIDQSIKPDESVLPGAEVVVTVSLGTKINYALKSIKNKTVDEAVQLLTDAGVVVSSEMERAFSEEVPRDRVIGWQPEGSAIGSASVKEGSVVRLIVSAGSQNELVIMPNLLGMDQEAAKAMLSDSGLQLGEITEVPSASTPKGYVTGQSVPENVELQYGTKIDIVVSSALDPNAQPAPQLNSTQETASNQDNSTGYYYGSIDTVCTVGHAQGPDSASKQVMVGIRLKQRTADGSFEYTVLEEPKPVAFGSKIPVSFRNIKGIEFVEKGDIQVYNAETNEVYNTYTIDFKAKGGL